MKYDSQIPAIQQQLTSARNILIALPKEAMVDHLAAGLALFLSLNQIGKEVSIVTEGIIKVGQANLFGVGQIQNKLPQISGGNFTITLGGVVDPQSGTVPSLQSVDWAPTGADKKDLKLTFKIQPGQKFEPTFITPSFEGGNFDLIFVLGAVKLDDLGGIYTNNQASFAAPIVNIDNQVNNSQFGAVNLIDHTASCVSEIVAQILSALNLPFDQDIASNILAGIFAATDNLQGDNLTADTYEVVAQALRRGGQKPLVFVTNQVSVAGAEGSSSTSAAASFDLSKILLPQKPSGTVDNFVVPPVIRSAGQQAETKPVPSPEEQPTQEAAEEIIPEADWLTPKIYKGGSVG